ncbi:hypothetical protein M0Q50_05255 [bacterium]|jgi:hypothetical protein|nr:hypothetical protein [bacterium]
MIREYKKNIEEGYKRKYYCVYVNKYMIGDEILVRYIESTFDNFSGYANNRIVPVRYGDGFVFKTTIKEKMPINIEELLIQKLYNKLKKDIIEIERRRIEYDKKLNQEIKEIERKRIKNSENINNEIKQIEQQLKSSSFNIITRKYKLDSLFEK